MGGPSTEIRWGRLAFCFALGLAIWLLPAPRGLSTAGWHVFAVFAGVVTGFLLQPLDMGPTVLLGLLALAATGTTTLKALITDGYGNSTVWLVVFAFLIADAVEATGLGRRTALFLLFFLGRSITGLGYAIAAAELVLAPFIPSNTARGGGVLAPIVHGIAKSLGSVPGETPRRGGAYLVQVGGHANLVTSAMFLTAMAGNTQIPPAARSALGVEFGYTTWLRGSIVPGILSLALVPLLLRLLERPERSDMAAVRERVAADLAALGPWKRGEVLLGAILAALLLLWSQLPGLDTTTVVALGGVLAIVVLGIRTWRDLAGCWHAWDALIWLGGYVALAEALKTSGFTAWLAEVMEAKVGGYAPVPAAVILALIYFATMFFFSQLTAHIAALAGTFFAVAGSVGSPPLLSVALIAYFSCLCGAPTPWSTGPVIIYFSQGYVSVGRWMRNGLVVAVFHIALWLTVGMLWWRHLEWW